MKHISVPDDIMAEAPADTAGQAIFFTPLRPVKLPDQVYEQILSQIIFGRFALGQRLPSEPQLCQLFGVSRPVVREALSRLRADGIVASRRGSGSYVVHEPGRDFLHLAPRGEIAELLHCNELRMALEGEAAFLAAQRRRPADLGAIDTAVAGLNRAIANGDVGTAEDLAFHRAIALAAGNDLFVRTLDMLDQPMSESVDLGRRLSRLATKDRLRIVQREHVRIRDAIAAAKPEAARATMRGHIDNARNRMLGFRRDL